MNHFEAGEAVPQKRYKTVILFNENSISGSLQREVRQCTKSRADFEPTFSGLDAKSRNVE